MYWEEIRRISRILGFCIAVVIFAVNLLMGNSFFTSALHALIALLLSSIVFLFAFSRIGKILTGFLDEQRAKKETEDAAIRKEEEEALRKERESQEAEEARLAAEKKKAFADELSRKAEQMHATQSEGLADG